MRERRVEQLRRVHATGRGVASPAASSKVGDIGRLGLTPISCHFAVASVVKPSTVVGPSTVMKKPLNSRVDAGGPVIHNL